MHVSQDMNIGLWFDAVFHVLLLTGPVSKSARPKRFLPTLECTSPAAFLAMCVIENPDRAAASAYAHLFDGNFSAQFRLERFGRPP